MAVDFENLTDRMKASERPSQVWQDEALCRHVLPELNVLRQVRQRGNESVFDHTMKVLDGPGIATQIVLWAKLLHDTGKANGFRGHEIVSEAIIRNRLPQLGASPETVDAVARIARTHMIDLKSYRHPQAIRNWIAWVGRSNTRPWFVVRRDDMLAYGPSKRSLKLLDRFADRVTAQEPRQPQLTFEDLPVTVKDITTLTGLDDEAAITRVADHLVEAVNSQSCSPDRVSLLMAIQFRGVTV